MLNQVCCAAGDKDKCCALGLIVFSLLGLWNILHTLFPTTILLFGSFWSWVVFLIGIKHAIREVIVRTGGSCAKAWVLGYLVIALIGFWYILGDMYLVPTYGISLLHVITFVAPLVLFLVRCTEKQACNMPKNNF